MEKSRALVSDSQRIGLSALVSALELEASPENADDALLEATGLWRSSIEPLEEEEEAQRRVGRKVKRALRDSESYEDSTFYSLLLKDFIQNSTANSLEGADITALRQLKKRRQNVNIAHSFISFLFYCNHSNFIMIYRWIEKPVKDERFAMWCTASWKISCFRMPWLTPLRLVAVLMQIVFSARFFNRWTYKYLRRRV